MKKKMVKTLAAVALAAVCLVQFSGMASQARSQGLADLGRANEIKGYAAEAGVVSPQAATPVAVAYFVVGYLAMKVAEQLAGDSDDQKENRITASTPFRLSELDR